MGKPFDPQNVFDEYYYQHGCGAPYERNEVWLAFFQTIADRIIEDIQPNSVLDAGCAKGFLVEGFRKRGVEAWGVDISEFAVASVHESIRPFCKVGSITQPFGRRFDLIISIEVLEHMQPAEGEQAIANLCAHADDIIFTSTPFDYKETTHYNVQPPEVWSREFARHGFFRDVDYEASYITAWATRYRRRDQPVHQLTYDYERRFWLLRKENTDLRQLSNELRDQIRQMDAQIQDLNNRLQAARLEMEQPRQSLQDQLTDLASRRDAEVQALQTLLDQVRKEVETTRAELVQQCSASETAIGELERQLQQAHQKTNELQQRWDALEQSRTWKILTTLYKIRRPDGDK